MIRQVQDKKTIEQAMMDSGIDSDNINTDKIKDKDAFSIYEDRNGFGIIQYVKSKRVWQYRGASGFEQSTSGKAEPVTFGTATWLKGDYISKGNNTYKSVCIGEIHEVEIAKVILKISHGKYNELILTSDRLVPFIRC